MSYYSRMSAFDKMFAENIRSIKFKQIFFSKYSIIKFYKNICLLRHNKILKMKNYKSDHSVFYDYKYEFKYYFKFLIIK